VLKLRRIESVGNRETEGDRQKAVEADRHREAGSRHRERCRQREMICRDLCSSYLTVDDFTGAS